MKLQKLALSALFALFVGSFQAFGQGSFTLPEITIPSNTLVMIAGPSAPTWAGVWVSNTAYSQGAVVRSQATGPYYFAIVAGTSTNVAARGPVGTGTITDGTVSWRPCPSKTRKTLIVQDTGTNTACQLFITDFITGGTNMSSVVTLTSGMSVCFDPAEAPQSAVYAISTHNTKITVYDR
jgi:hypothetical protein